MTRPLLITDCDEVLLHMVVPFADWCDTAHHIHFDLEHGDFANALRHKASGEPVEQERIWPLLCSFFETEMHRQQPISGAVAAIGTLAEHADIVVLTNIAEAARDGRRAQLAAVGIDAPVYCNQGGKGELLKSIVAEYNPSVTVFVDDLAHNHQSVARHAPEVFRLHMIGEPRLATRIAATPHAHARIDGWQDASHWIMERFRGAPL